MVAARRLSLALPAGVRVERLAIGADPGVQFGLALAALAFDADGAPRICPLELCILGQRAVRSPKSAARPAVAPSYPELLAEARRLVAVAVALGSGADLVLACEDWFVGPNGLTVRDTAQQFYFAQAAAQELGLSFRPASHATWKREVLGTARPASPATAYAAAAASLVGEAAPERWRPASGAAPAEADDAAALCVAAWYLGTEVAR